MTAELRAEAGAEATAELRAEGTAKAQWRGRLTELKYNTKPTAPRRALEGYYRAEP